MITITLKDWAGFEQSKTTMTEQELGYDGNTERLQRMAQNVASQKTACVTIEQDGKVIAQANYLNALV